jgi:hypothetical protein
MVKKGIRNAKAAKPQKAVKRDRPERWTVRGVSAPLQRAAAEAARGDGLTLGAWVSRLVETAVTGREPPAGASVAWREAIEARVARLEAAAGFGSV